MLIPVKNNLLYCNVYILQNNFKQSVISFLLLCCCNSTHGQQFNFDLYNKSNGLVNNEVHCMVQGKDGFMYFGTPSGLSVYDGASFTNYDLRKGFRSNIISGIQELQNGQVIVFTGNNEYYRLNNQHLSIDAVVEKSVAIKNTCATQKGIYYASTFSGLYSFSDGVLSSLPVNRGKAFPGVNCVIPWQDSLLIVGRSYQPVDIYNTHTWQLVASSNEKLFVRNFCADSAGNIWISSIGSGLLLLKPNGIQQGLIQFEKLPAVFNPFVTTEFRAVVTDKENNHWMATINNGLIKYNPTSQQFQHIGMEQGLISNTIFSLYCDKEDNIWIGTNRGVQKLVHKDLVTYGSNQGLPADLVLDALPLPNNRIITCGYSGVAFIPDFGGKIKIWQPPLQDEYFTQFVSLHNGYYGLSLRKLVALNISPDNITAKTVYDLPQHFSGITAWDGDKLLLGGDSSILLFSNQKLSPLTNDSVHNISCMAIDAAGDLCTSSFKNTITVYHLQKNNTNVTATVAFHYVIPGTTAGDNITCITTDKHNRIVYGTSQAGITVLSKTNNTLQRYAVIDIKKGLSSNHILSLYWYNDTTLLVGNGYGLDKIIFSTTGSFLYVHNITDYYNLSASVYCIQKDAAGNMVLGTESGLIKIPSVDIEQYVTKTPPVDISSVHLLNNPDSLLNFKQPIELPYDNSGITIFFASPSFTNEKSTRYVYRLMGSGQNNWSQPSASNSVSLLNLPPGHYHFEIKTVNILGALSATEAAVDLVIQPAFWQSWWFYVLVLLVVAAVLYVIIKRRIGNIRRESALKNKITEAEMMALRAQMNPHFIFNCMNIIDGLITSNRTEEAQDFLQKFSKLIRLVLENSQYQLVPLQQDLQALELYTGLEVIRNNHCFTYTFDVDETLLENDYKIPPLLLQPYIENAIVHGLRNKENGEGKLLVRIKKEADKIRITIEDNGIGRTAATALNEANKKPHQQLGMKVTGKRIDLLQLLSDNQVEFNIDNINQETGTGTRVTIVLPEPLKFQ